MPNITLKELIDKIKDIPRYYCVDPNAEVITDVWMAGTNNRNYPPGSIIFRCETRNTKVATEEDVHLLSIHPHKITNPQ